MNFSPPTLQQQAREFKEFLQRCFRCPVSHLVLNSLCWVSGCMLHLTVNIVSPVSLICVVVLLITGGIQPACPIGYHGERQTATHHHILSSMAVLRSSTCPVKAQGLRRCRRGCRLLGTPKCDNPRVHRWVSHLSPRSAQLSPCCPTAVSSAQHSIDRRVCRVCESNFPTFICRQKVSHIIFVSGLPNRRL